MIRLLLFLFSMYSFSFAYFTNNPYTEPGYCPDTEVQGSNFRSNKTFVSSNTDDFYGDKPQIGYHYWKTDNHPSTCSEIVAQYTDTGSTTMFTYYNYSYDVTPVVTCTSPDVYNSQTNTCDPPVVPTCDQPGQHLDTNTNSCVCDNGKIMNSNNQCCDVGNADSKYNVDQATCESSPAFIKIDDLEGLTNITWNTCLNECIGKSASCPGGKVFDSNGYCVTPALDDTACKAQGGTLQNYRNSQVDTCIDNAGTSHTPCCSYEADCVVSGSIVNSVSTYVACAADTNQTNENNNTSDLNVTDGGNTPPNNQCSTCPSQYPIANDQGSCENSNGEILMCPEVDYNNSNPTITCGTCGALEGNWTPTSTGMCKRTTSNGIVQYSSCPTATNNDTNITNPPDTNTSLNGSSQNGDGTKNTCTNCPAGFKSVSGNCVIVGTDGKIISLIACPGGTSAIDANGTGPADNNGSEDNASDLLNGFGKSLEGQMENAYKSYSFFNETDCGTLDVSPSVYLFNNPNAEIKDPLPMFVDIMSPYRNIVKNFLLLIAVVIGLFDFFKRS